MIASRKKIPGIDLFEVVHVNQAKRQRAGITGAAAKLGLDQVLDGSPIRQTGERIRESEFFQHPVLLLQLVIGFLEFMGSLTNSLLQVQVEPAEFFVQLLGAALQ